MEDRPNDRLVDRITKDHGQRRSHRNAGWQSGVRIHNSRHFSLSLWRCTLQDELPLTGLQSTCESDSMQTLPRVATENGRWVALKRTNGVVVHNGLSEDSFKHFIDGIVTGPLGNTAVDGPRTITLTMGAPKKLTAPSNGMPAMPPGGTLRWNWIHLPIVSAPDRYEPLQSSKPLNEPLVRSCQCKQNVNLAKYRRFGISSTPHFRPPRTFQ